MRFSVEVGHPAHVHYWRNVIKSLVADGHEVTILARDKEITLQLLRAYNLSYRVVGRSRKGLLKKALGVPLDDLRVLQASRAARVEFMLSTGIPGSAHASRILAIPHLALIDTEIARIGRILTEPFSDVVCTPACFKARVSARRHIRFNGYLELMYLHPRYFTPDPTVLELAGIEDGQEFVVVRFSSWDSSHDFGSAQVPLASSSDRFSLVRQLAKEYQVLVSSEVALPPEFEPYKLRIPPERFHDVLAHARFYVGEGATAASEAGVLGVPWVYVSNSPRSYLDDQQQRFGLGQCVSSVEQVFPLLDGWAERIEAGEWARRRNNLLADTIDVTEFIVRLVESWPSLDQPQGAVA